MMLNQCTKPVNQSSGLRPPAAPQVSQGFRTSSGSSAEAMGDPETPIRKGAGLSRAQRKELGKMGR